MSIAQMLFDHKARELAEAQQQMDWARAVGSMPAPPDPELIRRYTEEQAKKESAVTEEQINAAEEQSWREAYEREKSGEDGSADLGPDGRDVDQ